MTALRDILIVRSRPRRRAPLPVLGHCDRCTPPEAFAAGQGRLGRCRSCGWEAVCVPADQPAGLPMIRRANPREPHP